MRTRLMAVPLLGLAVLLAACSANAGSATQAPAAAAAAATAATSGGGYGDTTGSYSKSGGGAGATAASVALADSGLGKILVDGKGMTLYVFTPDKAGASTCYDKCAAAWPPLVTTGAPTVGAGLTGSDFGTAARKDGAMQVTFHGWPVYYFASDKAAGDTKGQGIGGKWFVVDGTGAMVGANAAAASPAATGGVAINLGDSKLGKILVDGKGMTLYMFTADSNGKSACSGDCLTNWPALISAAAPTLGAGLDAEDFKTITRDDGSKQVTFYGQPLYYFAADKAAGDTNGQGIGGKWYVLGADGKPVK